jgi:asparagine synthase (glutamine-hydrolysing)
MGIHIEPGVAFGHRRLAIIDLSSDGAQPMFWEDKSILTFNGEIYNYIEIREELQSLGYKFRSKTDSEVILAAYDAWGSDCVLKFNGMWAFAIYDRIKKLVFCSRDRFGVKPFYYVHEDKFLAFGSEIRQLLPLLKKITPDYDTVSLYLSLGLEEYGNRTFFENVYRLAPSHNLFIDLKNSRVSQLRYYSLRNRVDAAQLDAQQAASLLESELSKSIALRLRSDVMVGTCLSGGLDSSAIAAIASKKYNLESGGKLFALTASSILKENDETHFAKVVAENCNLDWVSTKPETGMFVDVIDDVILAQEEPFGSLSIFMQYFVMNETKKKNCKVMLDGQGADETLLGYEGYFIPFFEWLTLNGKFLKFIGELSALKSFRTGRQYILSRVALSLAKRFVSRHRPRLSSKSGIKILPSANVLDELYRPRDFFDFQVGQLEVFSLAKLLRYEDKNSMWNSIETRLPYVDFNLVETSISFRPDVKIANGYLKYVLRLVAQRHLPPEIAWRTNKFGFEAPSELWMKEVRQKFSNDLSNSDIICRVFDGKFDEISDDFFWRLFNLARWAKIFSVSC